MLNSAFKITGFFAILTISFVSCQQDDFGASQLTDEDARFQYKKMSAFCESNPQDEIWSKSFVRNSEGDVIEEITYHGDVPDFKITSVFNTSGVLLTDSTFYYVTGNWFYQNSHKYIYERTQLIEIQRYEPGGNVSHKTLYKYNGDKIRWEDYWYFANGKWNFQYADRLEFNGNGNMIKKESFQLEQKDKVYDTFLYEYKNGKLVEEKRVIITGETDYILKFTYNADGTLNEKIEDGNVIEKNFYTDGRLTEKHIFYFGIDPGFSPCLGNFIYKYEY